MATQKIYDLAAVVDSYTDRDGKTKNKYQTVGAVLQKDDGGKFIILEKWFNPAGINSQPGKTSIILSMFEPRDQNASPQQQAQPTPQRQPAPAPQQAAPAAGFNDFSDEIPF